jgi:outer membrane protein OmpA-like peptidoglycan-associated protein
MAIQYLRNIHLILPILILSLLSGCTATIVGIGIGVGVGAATYTSGELSKIYEVDYHRAVSASTDTLHQLKIFPLEKISDELKTDIKAKRPDGTPISVKVERIERNCTEISVRTGTIGIWDIQVSTQVHEFIEKKLNSHLVKNAKSAENTATKHDKTFQKRYAKEKVLPEDKPSELPAKSDPSADKMATKSIPPSIQYSRNPVNSKFIIFFQKNSNKLQSKSIEKLKNIAALILKNPDAQLKITGFADSKGSTSFKRMLSETRASTVTLFLVAKGMAPTRSQTIVKSSAGKYPNQGAEIEILF